MIITPLDPDLFRWMVEEAWAEKGMVQEFDRLWGTNLAAPARRTPIEIMVDEATGHSKKKLEHDYKLFLEFVEEYIYDRLVPRCIRIYPGYV